MAGKLVATALVLTKLSAQDREPSGRMIRAVSGVFVEKSASYCGDAEGTER